MGCTHHAGGERKVGVGEILRDHAGSLRLGRQQARVVRHLVACRTGELGGHLEECDQCGYARFAYHSCRDRHCPVCGTLDQALWAEAQEQSLLPVPYFHTVFTVPTLLQPFFRRAPALALRLLFHAVSETLLEVAHRRLGARIAVTAVLHTWNQRLLQHPHVHCLVTGGGISDDGTRWIACRPSFFLPYAILRRVFRGKMLAKLAAALDNNTLGVARPLGRHLLESAARQRWVVYAKAPLAGPEQVVRYVSRYTRRIALSNSRIVDYDGKEVAFSWRDRAHGNEQKVMRLSGPEFARRFVLHILPARFVRIRHYGMLSNRVREASLARCRALVLGGDLAPPLPRRGEKEDRAAACLRLFGKDPTRCPACGQGPDAATIRVDSLRSRPTDRRGWAKGPMRRPTNGNRSPVALGPRRADVYPDTPAAAAGVCHIRSWPFVSHRPGCTTVPSHRPSWLAPSSRPAQPNVSQSKPHLGIPRPC